MTNTNCTILRYFAMNFLFIALVLAAVDSDVGSKSNKLTPLRLTGWVQGVPTSAPASGFTLPLTMDRAITGWVCNLNSPTTPLRLDFTIGGMEAGSVNATDLFYNDKPAILGAPDLLHLNFIFYIPDNVLTTLNGRNATLAMRAVDPATGNSMVFAPGAAATAGKLLVALEPRLSPAEPRIGDRCLGSQNACLSKGDALSFGQPWFEDNPTGWSDTKTDLFKLWNCSSPNNLYDTIVRLNILPYDQRPGANPSDPGDRYHHRGFKKDSVHLAEDEVSPGGGPVIHFSAARTGVPGIPGKDLGRAGQVASNWGLKKAVFSPVLNRWQIFDQLDSPTNGYGISSLDGVDGVNMIMNDGGMIGWGPTSTVAPHDPRCTIPGLAAFSNKDDIPSYPLLGTGPLGLTTVQEYLHPNQTVTGVTAHCVHMNPKLSEFDSDGVPHAMWAYLWSVQPAHGCYLPTGMYIDAGYYAYRIDDQNTTAGWQLDILQGKAVVNQTRGQAMKKEWGAQYQTSFIYSAWDLPPNDVPPSTIFRVDTKAPQPRFGETLLQCYGTNGNKVHLGEATGNRSQLVFLVDFDEQVARSAAVGEVFGADIYFAFNRAANRGKVPEWARPSRSGPNLK
eukprot:m.160302 g.160302  ORF g.160302 m.160302 type:complete len:617 (+) comp14551_c0_seq1:538-2388(+)